MKMSFMIFIVLVISNYIICAADIPSYVAKGIEAEENPEIPYSDFLKAQEYYKEKINTDIEFEHLQAYKRPESFYESGVYKSKRLKYYSFFAGYGYCSPDSIKSGMCCSNSISNEKGKENPNGWILVDYGSATDQSASSRAENSYAILRSDLFKKVVITFPGTKDMANQLMQEITGSQLASFNLQTLKGNIKMSKYFGSRAYELIDLIFTSKNIKDMKISQGYQVIFTGHSLGGATAAASLLFSIDRGFITKELNKPVLITYGQPRTGNEAFALAVNKYAEVIYRIVNKGDIVPQVPLVLTGYRHTIGEISVDGGSIVKNVDEYDVNVTDDSQSISILDLFGASITSATSHIIYLDVLVGGVCLGFLS